MIPIRTNEQLIELAARSLYLLSMLRAYQKYYEETRCIYDKDWSVKKWELRIDEFLEGLGATEFESLKILIEQLSIHEDDGDKRKSIKTLPTDGSNNFI